MQLYKKNILITGATSGIGLKLVEKLYQHNTIYIIARNEHKITELKKSFPNVIVYKADLSKVFEIELVAKKLINDVNYLDVLINNAAVQYLPLFPDNDFSFKSIHEEITINFTAVCSLCYLLLPLLNQQKHSVILNINSGLALAPKTSSAVYCATKSALNAFSKSLQYQLHNTPIKVQQAFLPLVDTQMTVGRKSKKMSAENASLNIINGIEKSIVENDIGKVKLLRLLTWTFPRLAKMIMRNN